MSFENKVAIVTGGSRGIGRAIVEELSGQGAKVFFTYHRNEEAAEQTSVATHAEKICCSQTDQDAVDKAVDHVLKTAGKIDILINNAGITADQYLMMMPFEDWDKVINTNVHGTFRWVKAVCRPMINAHDGVIINISSVAAIVGIGGQTNYAASKGAIVSFTRALAAELGPKGIRVNAVLPGFIETDMTAKMPRQIKHTNMERIMLRRFGKPQEVAAAVSFLASSGASYIVGQAIVVDGGLTTTVV